MLPEPAVPWERSACVRLCSGVTRKPLLELHPLTLAWVSSCQQLDALYRTPALTSFQMPGTENKQMRRVPPPMGLRGPNPKCQLAVGWPTNANRRTPWAYMIYQCRYTCLYSAEKDRGITSQGQAESPHCK